MCQLQWLTGLFVMLAIRDGSTTFSVTDYLYPKFFWPFDYQTTAAEVIENVNVVENGPIGITGEKPGYCRFHFHQTSVTLGTFTLKCLRKPSDCKDGLTMAFWIRLTDVTFHKESILKEEVSILRTSHSAYAQHYGIRIWYSVLKGDVKLHASVILNEEQVTEVSINAMEWYHVVLSFSVNSGLQFFVNFKRSRITSRHKHAALNINEVKLFLGQYPITRGIGSSLLSSKLSIDNLAIWNRLLNRNDVSKVYLAGLSHINVHKGCLNDKNQFAVTWNGTADYYSHLRNYQVVWWSGKNGGSKKEASRIVLPSNFSTVAEKELNIVIDFFELSTLYNVRIDAHTKGNITFGTEIQCSTGDSTKGNTLKIVAVNPFTLSVIWKSIDESKYFVYKVTCKQINGELVFDKRTTTLSLNVTIGNLIPQTDYKVYIERLDTTTLIKSYYTGNPNTLPLSSFVRTSVLKAEVVGATWSTAKLRFILHPELKEHHMRYIVKQTGDGKVISKRFSVMLMDKIDMDIKGLHENTTYAFDVQLFDKRSGVAGPNMSVPLIVTTNVRFPPPIDMFIINATAKTITLSITLPSLMAKTHLHVTHLKVSLSLQHLHEHKIIKINESNHIVWNNLEQYTTYQISAVTGDSEGNYGEVGKVISAMTLDEDECNQAEIRCPPNSKCLNTLGSYRCPCLQGFMESHSKCEAINEKSMCDRQMMRNVVWQPTEIGFIASSPCPDGKTGNASRPCMNSTSGKPMWGEMDLSECISKEMTNILLMQPLKRDELQVAKKIDTFVSNEPDMFGGDLRQVVNLMDGLVATNKTKEDAFARTMVNITSSLLKKSTKKAWNDLPQEKRSKDAAKLLETSDTVVEVSANIMLKKQRSKSIVTENIVMHLQKLSPADVINETEIQVVSAKLPIEVFSGNVTVATVTYNGLSDLIGVPKNTKLSKESSNITINSKIISVSLFPQIKETFEKPVVIVHKLTKNVIDKVPNCVFWESERQSWSHEGCKVSKANESHVTCNCHHLTNFAVLMSVTDVADNLAGDHRFALNLITIIGISISLAALVASFFTFLMVRAIHSLRNTIHQHLVVALFIAEGLFLFGIDKTDSKVGCQVIAASLHYFFLVAFAIMALEGIVLYLMLVRVYRSMGTSGYGSAKYIAICWVVPIIFIIINVAIDQDSYAENRDFCWLSIKHGFIWTFVGPIIFIIMMNIVILFMTLRIMSVKGKKRTSTSEEIWFWIRGCFLLLSILGVTWIIGVFYVDMNTVFVAYLFNVVNSLQGMSIFIFHCLCDPRVRKAYYNFFCCVRSRHQSFLRSNSRTRTTSTGSKTSLKKSKNKRKYKLSTEKGDDVPLYLNGATPDISILGGRSTSTPDDSFGVLVGTNKF